MILAKYVLLFILMQSIDCLDLPCSFLECVVDVRLKVAAEAANKKEEQEINIANQVETFCHFNRTKAKDWQKHANNQAKSAAQSVSFDCALPSRALCAQCSAAPPDS